MSALAEALHNSPYNRVTAVLSIDDLYLSRQSQAELAARHSNNPLIQYRGQPSTHDIQLAASLFSCFRSGRPLKLPIYDKGAYNGLGDRMPEQKWHSINEDGHPPTQLVILEGWCVGFQALDHEHLKQKWETAAFARDRGRYQGRLGYNRLEHVDFINGALKEYHSITKQLDALIHLDAEDTLYVYSWRLEQEHKLRMSQGSGMTDDEVKNFVDGYYPSYELYNDGLRAGLFNEKGRQIRLVVGRQRDIKEVIRL